MTLSRLTLILLGTFVVTITALAVILITSSTRSWRSLTEFSQTLESVRLSEDLRIQVLSANRQWLLFALNGEEQHNINRQRDERGSWETLLKLRELAITEEEHTAIADITNKTEEFFEAQENFSGPALSVTDAYLRINPTLRDVLEASASLANHYINSSVGTIERNRRRVELIYASAIATLIFSITLLPIALFSVRKRIYRPIRLLQKSIADVYEGKQINQNSPDAVSELNEVAEALNDLSWRLADQKNTQLRFLAGVAHDLKNPLSAIKMSTELLADEHLDPNDRREMVNIISRQTDQLNRMIGDFLDARRVESGHLELKKQPVDLRLTIHDSVVLQKQTSKRHEIIFARPPASIECNCDPTRITQVLNNLLSNAIRYSPSGGEVSVSLSAENNQAVIRVADEGIGISPEDLDKVFEPFRRTRLTKETIPGVGLGLSISKRIIEGHSGTIEVKSAPGEGSVFTIKLPLLRTAKPAQQTPREEEIAAEIEA